MQENQDLVQGNEAPAPSVQFDEQARHIAEVANFAFGDEIPEHLLYEDEKQVPEAADVLDADIPPVEITQQSAQVDYLKELGFPDLDSAKAEIQRLRNAPPAEAKPSDYINEESKLIAAYINEGKEEELYKFFSGRRQIANIEAKTNEEKLKTYIKLKNPRFDEELVQDEYDSLYKVFETDELGDEIDPIKLRKNKLRIEQRMENDLQEASSFFENYKKQIQLHPIQQSVDENYEAYKASMQSATDNYNNDVVPSVTSLTADKLGMSVSLNDSDSQISATVSFIPSEEDLKNAKEKVLNVERFLAGHYEGDKLKAAEITSFFLKGLNFDKYVQSAIRQAVNAERKNKVIANSTPSLPTRQNMDDDGNNAMKAINDFAFAPFGL